MLCRKSCSTEWVAELGKAKDPSLEFVIAVLPVTMESHLNSGPGVWAFVLRCA